MQRVFSEAATGFRRQRGDIDFCSPTATVLWLRTCFYLLLSSVLVISSLIPDEVVCNSLCCLISEVRTSDPPKHSICSVCFFLTWSCGQFQAKFSFCSHRNGSCIRLQRRKLRSWKSGLVGWGGGGACTVEREGLLSWGPDFWLYLTHIVWPRTGFGGAALQCTLPTGPKREFTVNVCQKSTPLPKC